MRSQWGKLAGDYASDPKVVKLSAGAELLYIRLLAYSFQYRTERLPREALALCSRKLRHRDKLIAEILAQELLHEDDLDAGYVFPSSWSRWQSRYDSSAHQSAGQGGRSRAGEEEKNRYTYLSNRSTLAPAQVRPDEAMRAMQMRDPCSACGMVNGHHLADCTAIAKKGREGE